MFRLRLITVLEQRLLEKGFTPEELGVLENIKYKLELLKKENSEKFDFCCKKALQIISIAILNHSPSKLTNKACLTENLTNYPL